MQKSILTILCAFASIYGMQIDTTPQQSNFVNISPFSLVSGTLLLNYEHTFASKHGAFLEGSYTIPLLATGYSGAIGYRYHLKSGSKGPFLGPIIRASYIRQKIADEWKNEYTYGLRTIGFGANGGNRWALGKKLNITFRIGLCYPIHQLTWDTPPPETIGGISVDGLMTLIKVVSALDSELTIGLRF